MRTQLLRLEQASDLRGCVLAYGHFSTIHPGHIRYLRHARDLGGPMVVALIGDGPNDLGSPYPFKQDERAEALTLLDLADAILLLRNDELSAVIEQLQPQILVLGTELETEPRLKEALALLCAHGGTVQFHAGDVHYASAELLTSSERDLRHKRIEQFKTACKRQGLDCAALIASMRSWADTRLIVLGDTIVDQYAACEAIGMSAEAPVVVVRELAKRNFIGAAAVVAAHIRALGAQC